MTTPDALRYSRIQLSHGTGAIPAVGFGTLIPDPVDTKQATKTALGVGFRHLDCAERYGNEEAVGDAMREAFEAGIAAAGRLVRHHEAVEHQSSSRAGQARIRREPQTTASRLCRLLFDPYPLCVSARRRPRSARRSRSGDLRPRGHVGGHLGGAGAPRRRRRCGSIGLSDITLDKLREIVAVARIKPAVVEVESHPYLPEWELLDFCQEQGIVLLAFAPLGHSMEPKIVETR